VEFSQADRAELERLQQGAAQVRQQLREGNIDQATANRMTTQIRTGLDPLRQAQQAAQTQLTQQAAQQAMETHAAQTSWQSMSATDRARHVRDHTVDLGNGNSIYTGDPSGRTHFVRNENQAAAEARRTAAQERQDKADETNDEHFRHTLEHAQKFVRQGGTAAGAFTEAEQQQIDQMMRDSGFHSSNLTEHRAARTELREDRPLIRPDARPTERQQRELDTFAAARELVTRANDGAQNSWRMPRDVRERYAGILREVERQSRLPWAAPQQSAPQQPTPRQPEQYEQIAAESGFGQ
jgi:hypothetical protein